MDVFLSWSGEVSHRVASALRDWLPYMIQSVRPFLSSDDIGKGDRWGGVLAEELKDATYGIICVTPYNIYKPWMNFEAGALTRVREGFSITPFLFQIQRASLSGPLAQFQSCEYQEQDVLALVQSINGKLPKQERLDQGLLRRTFGVWWLELDKALRHVPTAFPGETRTFYRWLSTFQDLAVHDVSHDCSKVWYVVSDAFKYATQDQARQRILANLGRVKYRYLIPEPGHTADENVLRDLDEMKAQHPGQLEYRCVQRAQFEKEAPSDYVMFESIACGQPTKVFVKAPVRDADDYWFEAEDRAASNFYHRFEELWDTAGAGAPSTVAGAADATGVATEPSAAGPPGASTDAVEGGVADPPRSVPSERELN